MKCLSAPTLSTLSLLLLHNLSILEVEAKEVSKFAGVYSVRSGELNKIFYPILLYLVRA